MTIYEKQASVKFIRRTPSGRVLARSYNGTNTNGGVSYTNANNASTNSNANIASRLTFGEIIIMRPLHRQRVCPEYAAEGGASPLGGKHQISINVW